MLSNTKAPRERYNPYPDENDIIPYSPRKKFGFTSPIYGEKIIDLESMKSMSIDQIINLYKEGYVIEGTTEGQQTPMREREKRYGFANDVPIPPGVQERWRRERKYGFTGDDALPFEHDPPGVFERERKYGFAGSQDQTGNMSPTVMTAQDGIYVSSGAILLGVGLIALFYYLKSKGKI